MKTLPWRRSDLIAEINDKVWTVPKSGCGRRNRTATSSGVAEDAILRVIGNRPAPVPSKRRARSTARPTPTTHAPACDNHDERGRVERGAGTRRRSVEQDPEYAKRTGLPHLYITEPSRRAFQTPENELLARTSSTKRSVSASLPAGTSQPARRSDDYSRSARKRRLEH